MPRRCHRRNLSSESTFLISSRDCSPIRRRSPAICYGGSLPRSTHSIPGRSPKRVHPNKQLIDEKDHAKSGEIYNKSINSDQNELPVNQSFPLSRGNYSGPSSLESGKTSSLVISGPSSIDSGNKSLSLSRNSGRSSLSSSQCGSANTVAQVQNSPKNSMRHKLIKSNVTSAQKVTTSTSSNGLKSTSFEETSTTNDSMIIPSSNSNGSITLQVTNNSSGKGLQNTKIFVQNSCANRTSITFENGKFTENSNVFVINNESATNANGDIIATRKSLMSKPSSPLKHQNQMMKRSEKQSTFINRKENYCSENDEATSETGDSLSMISETSPDSSLIPFVDEDVADSDSRRQNNVQCADLSSHKYSKNIDESMNNRKLSLQIGSPNKSGNLVYNNFLKKSISPATHEKNNSMNMFLYENSMQPASSSVGNLKAEKSSNFLNSNPAINSDSLLNIFHKNVIAVGSEPNLITLNKHSDNSIQKINNCTIYPQTSTDGKTPTSDKKQEPNGMYSFPSLTDLSFNFTSLHAQKMLKGMSVNNSIDTLVELDINKPSNPKSSSNISPATVCTDFGMV